MAQVTTTIRLDSELKRRFDNLCEDFGMSVNTAFNIFAKAVVRSKSIPFKIEAEDADASRKGLQAFNSLRADSGKEITLDDINTEIAAYRREQSR